MPHTLWLVMLIFLPFLIMMLLSFSSRQNRSKQRGGEDKPWTKIHPKHEVCARHHLTLHDSCVPNSAFVIVLREYVPRHLCKTSHPFFVSFLLRHRYHRYYHSLFFPYRLHEEDTTIPPPTAHEAPQRSNHENSHKHNAKESCHSSSVP